MSKYAKKSKARVEIRNQSFALDIPILNATAVIVINIGQLSS